jgi:cytochrome c5
MKLAIDVSRGKVVPVIAAVLLLAGCGQDRAITEVPRFEARDLQQGRTTWMQVCRNCHLMGVAGAPAISDHAAWQSRLSGDRERLYQNAIRGIGEEGAWTMPPRGGSQALSDDDVRRAVDFMLAAVEALRDQ